jgi:hypothetical protein
MDYIKSNEITSNRLFNSQMRPLADIRSKSKEMAAYTTIEASVARITLWNPKSAVLCAVCKQAQISAWNSSPTFTKTPYHELITPPSAPLITKPPPWEPSVARVARPGGWDLADRCLSPRGYEFPVSHLGDLFSVNNFSCLSRRYATMVKWRARHARSLVIFEYLSAAFVV